MAIHPRLTYALLYGFLGLIASLVAGIGLAVIVFVVVTLFFLFYNGNHNQVDTNIVGLVIVGLAVVIGTPLGFRYGYRRGQEHVQDPKVGFPAKKYLWILFSLLAFIVWWVLNW